MISNSSPLIHLSKINQLHIFEELFEEVIVPEAVYDECVVEGEDRRDAKHIENADWINVKSIRNILNMDLKLFSIRSEEDEE
ncbi:MAG: hypothetical protein ACOCT9_01485 [archaeon]